MATRGEIKDAFYSRLVNSSTGTYDVVDGGGTVIGSVTVDEEDVELLQVEEEESLPQVLWDDNYLSVVYNGVGAGPDMREYEQDGETVAVEVWREYVEAQFTVYVRAANEGVKEPIYAAVRESFGKLGMGPWHETELHEHVIDVRVEDVSSLDTGDVEDVIRGDQVEVYVTFHRDYPYDVENIEQVESTVEGNSYITT